MPGSHHRTEELFPDRSLRQILARRDPVVHAVAPQDPVTHVLQLMSQLDIGLVVVLEAGQLVGVLSERDLVRLAGQAGVGALGERTVADLMTRDVATVGPDEPFGRCMALMEQRGARHLPVVDAGRVIAVVTVRDLLREAVAHHRLVLAEIERERLTAFQSSA